MDIKVNPKMAFKSTHHLGTLKRILASRKGQFVPMERHPDFLPESYLSSMNLKGVKVVRVHPEDETRKELENHNN